MNSAHWQFPLSSSDPQVVEKSMEGMRTSLRNAKLWGAQTVFWFPRSSILKRNTRMHGLDRGEESRELLPMAEDSKVIIAVEEVSNKFCRAHSRCSLRRRLQDSVGPGVLRCR